MAVKNSDDTLNKLAKFFTEYMKNPKQSALALCRKLTLSNSTLYIFCRENSITLDKIRDGQDYSKKLNKILDIPITVQEDESNMKEEKEADSNEEKKLNMINKKSSELSEMEIVKKSSVPIEKKEKQLTKEFMEDIVQRVDVYKKQGYSVADSMKKANIKLHFSNYYAYKKNLEKMNKKEIKQETYHETPLVTVVKKPRKKRTPKTKEIIATDIPNFPHSIEYIERSPKQTQEDSIPEKKEVIMMIGDADVIYDFYLKRKKGNN